MKLPFDVICIDLETTDIDSNTGSVIQIGAIAVNSEFKEIDSFETYIKPLSAHRNQKAMAVNRISEDVLSHSPRLQDALEMFEIFALKDKSKDNSVILAAWGNYFDIDFLKKQYDKINRKWPFSYKSLDLKTIAIWEFGKRNIPFPGGVQSASKLLNLEFEGIQHDALADIKNTFSILKKLLQQESIRTGWNT